MPQSLSASPSQALREAINPPADIESRIIDSLRARGYLTVTVHVALADASTSTVPRRFADGSDPRANFFWGALYGLETHLFNAAGWRRAYTDHAAPPIIRRIVAHRRIEPTAAWQARGISQPADLFVLANAWPAAQSRVALLAPLHDALDDEPQTITIDGRAIEFGASSIISGYLGENPLLDSYRDPLEDLAPNIRFSNRLPPKPMGVFYACDRSAVTLHHSVQQLGLYPVLFVRQPLRPEAYVVNGILAALIDGRLDDGFLAAAADAYREYHPKTSPEATQFLFYR